MIQKTNAKTMELFTTFPVDDEDNLNVQKGHWQLEECDDCGKGFCEDCPSKPTISDQTINCLECILNETQFHTSTPIKKVVDKFRM